MWTEAVVFFLGASILLYCLFAGADFGAGILAAFTGRARHEDQDALIARAIAPVWEANHVWLILAIVILFVGFPRAYAALSVTYHVPLTIMLLGIVLRGCAFTFRHYDAVQDATHRHYRRIFVISSFVTPFALGTVAGGVLLGRAADPTAGFRAAFVAPWANVFSFAVGAFTLVLFAFLAAVYLVGETDDPELRAIFLRRARTLNVLAVVAGGAVFAAAEASGLGLAALFAARELSVAAMIGATLLLVPLWFSLLRDFVQTARFLAATQVGCILVGWFRLQYPALVHAFGQNPVTLANSAAPPATMRMLLCALLVGSAAIFPSLFYLLRIFKRTRV